MGEVLDTAINNRDVMLELEPPDGLEQEAGPAVMGIDQEEPGGRPEYREYETGDPTPSSEVHDSLRRVAIEG